MKLFDSITTFETMKFQGITDQSPCLSSSFARIHTDQPPCLSPSFPRIHTLA